MPLSDSVRAKRTSVTRRAVDGTGVLGSSTLACMSLPKVGQGRFPPTDYIAHVTRLVGRWPMPLAWAIQPFQVCHQALSRPRPEAVLLLNPDPDDNLVGHRPGRRDTG